MPGLKRQSAFTLVELIVVIVISGILALVLTQFIVVPIDSYNDVSRRMRMVDIADSAMQKFMYDVRLALPNSIRTGCTDPVTSKDQCVEFLRAPAGGRYRAAPGKDNVGPGETVVTDFLKFNTAVDSFPVIGPLDFSGFTMSDIDGACMNNDASCVVVYNTGLTGANAWNEDNIATLKTGSSASLINFNNNDLPGQKFPAPSPYQRFYLVDTPVKYICSPAASIAGSIVGGKIERYQDFAFDKDAPTNWSADSTPGSTAALLVDHVSACRFRYDAGTETRNAVLTVEMTISEYDPYSRKEENIDLVYQVNVVNLP